MGRVCRSRQFLFERRWVLKLRNLSPLERGYETSPWSGGGFNQDFPY